VFFFFAADPGGIGSAPEKHTSCFTGQAFQRAEVASKEKEKCPSSNFYSIQRMHPERKIFPTLVLKGIFYRGVHEGHRGNGFCIRQQLISFHFE
jgi:hypothetical protein